MAESARKVSMSRRMDRTQHTHYDLVYTVLCYKITKYCTVDSKDSCT